MGMGRSGSVPTLGEIGWAYHGKFGGVLGSVPLPPSKEITRRTGNEGEQMAVTQVCWFTRSDLGGYPAAIDTCLAIARDGFPKLNYVHPLGVIAGAGPGDFLGDSAIGASTSDGSASVMVVCFLLPQKKDGGIFLSNDLYIYIISTANDLDTAILARDNILKFIQEHNAPIGIHI